MLGPGTDATRSINVLEFNCRMGDPETQPMMMRIKNDLTEVLELAVKGRLEQASIDWDRRIALGVVMAASNYPAAPRTGDAITQLPANTDDCVIFHAGTPYRKSVAQGQGVSSCVDRGGRRIITKK